MDKVRHSTHRAELTALRPAFIFFFFCLHLKRRPDLGSGVWKAQLDVLSVVLTTESMSTDKDISKLKLSLSFP